LAPNGIPLGANQSEEHIYNINFVQFNKIDKTIPLFVCLGEYKIEVCDDECFGPTPFFYTLVTQ